VHGHLMAGNIFDDTVVGGGTAAQIVLRLKPVNGNGNMETRDGSPGSRNLTESTGNDLDVNAALGKPGQKDIQLAIADQRITADNGEMQRAIFVHQSENIGYEGIAFVVRELPERKTFTRMTKLIGIAAGTTEWTFPGNFYRQRRASTAENPAPRTDNLLNIH
jgi:hypothetical protein